MAYSFKNQPTATAQIERYVEGANGTTFKLAGINGEQTNAGNFRTAVADFIGIGGIAIAQSSNALQRNLNQSVESDEQGEEMELYIEPNNFTIEQLNNGTGSTHRLLYLQFGSRLSAIDPSDIYSTMTFSGQKPAGSQITSKNDGRIQISGRASSDYTTGQDQTTFTVTVPSKTINGTLYKSSNVTVKITGGNSEEFENF